MTAQLTATQVLEVLRKACAEAGSQRAWAHTHNVAPSFVNDVLKGKRAVSNRILRALGYKCVRIYTETD